MRISDWSSDVCSSDLEAFAQALRLNLLSAGVFCVLFHLGPEWLIGPFSDDPEVLFYGAQFLRWISWNLLAMAAVMSCSGVFSGLGNRMPSLVGAPVRFVGHELGRTSVGERWVQYV